MAVNALPSINNQNKTKSDITVLLPELILLDSTYDLLVLSKRALVLVAAFYLLIGQFFS